MCKRCQLSESSRFDTVKVVCSQKSVADRYWPSPRKSWGDKSQIFERQFFHKVACIQVVHVASLQADAEEPFLLGQCMFVLIQSGS
jgi:hypothetical protein